MSLFGKRVFVDDQVKIRPLGWVLIHYAWYPYKKGKFRHRHLQRDNDVKSQINASTRQGTLVGERHEINSSSQPLERTNLTTPWLWNSSFQNHEIIYFCCFRHPVWVSLLQQYQDSDILIANTRSFYTLCYLEYQILSSSDMPVSFYYHDHYI
jgi:hypothetical protein